MLLDGYIDFLEETLSSEISWNNLNIEAMNESNIKETMRKIVKWILDKIRSIKKFIIDIIFKVIDAIINLRGKKKDEVVTPDVDDKIKVPKAMGFSNNIVNELNQGKIVSLCYSKNDRKDEINSRKQKLVDICVHARVTEDNMFILVGKEKLQGLQDKFKKDSERAKIHLNSLIKALNDVEKEFSNISDKDPEVLNTKIMNTSCCLNFVNVVLGEFTKTIVNHKSYLF